MAAVHVFPGPLELLMVLLMGSGGGLPLGIPPAAEDPVMSHVAPEQCLFYVTWAGMAAPDPSSPNQTEQLLAEPEVQQFVMQLEKRIVESIKREAGREGPEATAMIDDVHLVVKTVLTSPTAAFVSKASLDPKTGRPDVYAGAVVNLGDRAPEVKKALGRIENMAFHGGATEVKGKATTWRSLPMPEEAPPVLWAVKGKYLIVGVGRGEADSIYARARTETPAWLAGLRKQLALKRPANMMYLNVAAILKLAGPAMGPEAKTVLEALGLTNVRSLASATGLDETGCVTKTLLGTDGQLTGLLSLATAKPLSKEDLALIPKDSTLAVAARFDLAKAYQQLLEVLGKVDPRAREEFLGGMGEVEKQLEVNLAKDVFESLGDVWRVYNSPSEGGLVVTGLTAVVDVRDHDRLVAANGKLVLGKLAQEAARRVRERRRPRGAMISQFKHGDQTIFFLNVIGEEFPLAPAWCITDKELVVALYPQNVMAYLDRKTPGAAGGGSLADVPEVAAALAEGKGPVKLVYCDTPAIFKLVYPVVQIIAQMACGEMQREGIDVDVSILPSAPAILRHLRPGVIAVRRTEQGILIESHQTLPVGGGMTLGLPAVAFLGFTARVSQAPGPIFAASQARSTNNLKHIALAMHNHYAMFKGLPPAAAPMKEGQPPVSWRVRILPFIEQQALYDQYHLDEPWDSEHNKQLIPRIPQVYRSPGVYRARGSKVPEQGLTHYLAVVGDEFALSPTKKRQFSEIRDGTSNTILVVEADDSKAVPWTKPEDFTPDKKNPGAGLGSLRRGGFLAAFCDGSVRFVPGGLDPATLYALFTINGREVINWSQIQRAPRSTRTRRGIPVPLEKRAVPVPLEKKVERKLEEKVEEKIESAPRPRRRPVPRSRGTAPPLRSAP